MNNILYIPNHNKTTKIDKKFKKYTKEKNPDIIIVSGGDGSLLHAIQSYRYLNTPFLGVAAGTKNFLMDKINEKTIKKLIKDKISYKIVKISTIRVKVNRKRTNDTDNIIFESSAINDIVIGSSIMDFNTFSYKNKIIKGMGIIISTPIGSTGFNLNNGGKVIKDLESNVVAISTIASEDNFFEIEKNNQIKNIEILSERNNVKLFIDGTAKIFELKKGDIVSFERDSIIELIKIREKDL